MDYPIFEEDSSFNEIYRSVQWPRDSIPIDLIELDNSDSDQNHIDYPSIAFAKQESQKPFNNDQMGTQSSIQQILDLNELNQDTPNLSDDNHSKQQKIFQPQKHDQINHTQNNNVSAIQEPSITLSNRPKSKYNNMGGFLIGTFSQILQTQQCYRFENGWLQMYINGNRNNFEKMDFYDVFEVETSLASLKEKIFNLPRKDGAKKHLFNLINSEASDSQSIKISKSILRNQLVHALSQDFWLLQHVESRGFKPSNDDFLGTKKKQRHDDYLAYLKAIKYSLQIRGCIPKPRTNKKAQIVKEEGKTEIQAVFKNECLDLVCSLILNDRG